jgi:hypothetical protein
MKHNLSINILSQSQISKFDGQNSRNLSKLTLRRTLKAAALSLLITSLSAYASGIDIPNESITDAISNVSTMHNALDGNTNTIWNSGNYPMPTWIDIDLGEEQMIDTVSLDPAQLPNGQTTHNIFGVTEAGEWVYFGTISQYTSDGQWVYQTYPYKTTPVRKVLRSNLIWFTSKRKIFV